MKRSAPPLQILCTPPESGPRLYQQNETEEVEMSKVPFPVLTVKIQVNTIFQLNFFSGSVLENNVQPAGLHWREGGHQELEELSRRGYWLPGDNISHLLKKNYWLD